MPMEKNVDQSSFASILAGVQKMRDDYDFTVTDETIDRTGQTGTGQTGTGQTGTGQTGTGQTGTGQTVPGQTGTGQTVPGQTVPDQTEIEQTQSTDKTEKTDQTEISAEHPSKPQKKAAVPQIPPEAKTRSPGMPLGRRGPRNVHSYTSVQVAPSQKGNPLLEAPQMKLTPWSFNAQILSDYYINATLQVLFLSLKYHKLRPEYVWRRIDKLKGGSSSTDVHRDDDALRVLLVVVDIDSPQEVIRKLSVICIKNDLTMVVAWSFEEAGNYISALKSNEMAGSRVSGSIQGQKKTDFNSNIVNCLTTVRAVNKTDVANLLANFKSFRNIVAQSKGDGLSAVPGLGGRKTSNLKAAFYEPFIFNKEYQT